MDPVTHTMVGAALADAGPRRYTPLAAATLILAANAPDIDIVAQLGGEYTGLAWRRGLTHGIPALVVLPFVVLGFVLALDRLMRWRRPERPPVQPGTTLLLAFVGVLTHPTLDWLNTYGMRWLMPIDGRWFYGDALFIIDPWLWLGLGGVLFLGHSRRPSTVLAWSALAAAMSYLVLFQPIVPLAGKVLWTFGIGVFALTRLLLEVDATRLSRIALGGAALYIVVMIALNLAAQREVRATLAAEGVSRTGNVMVGPQPANPLAGNVVAATAEGYHLGSFHWLRSPRAELERVVPLPREGPEVTAALRTEAARNFLVWSRFPVYEVHETDDGFVVRIGDARYADRVGAGNLAGVTVELDRELRPR